MGYLPLLRINLSSKYGHMNSGGLFSKDTTVHYYFIRQPSLRKIDLEDTDIKNNCGTLFKLIEL